MLFTVNRWNLKSWEGIRMSRVCICRKQREGKTREAILDS